MPDELTFTQRVANPDLPDVEKITFRLKNGKVRIVMESETRATLSAFTLLDGEFSELIEWLVENATSGENPSEDGAV
jgi:hypothetical protein